MLAMRMLAFSSLFGEFTPRDLSSMKPRMHAQCMRTPPPMEFPALTFVQVGVSEFAPDFFDNLDVIKVR